VRVDPRPGQGRHRPALPEHALLPRAGARPRRAHRLARRLDIEALGEVTAAALTQPSHPAVPPLETEAACSTLTLEQLVPIEVVVRDAETGLPKEDEDGIVKTRAPFRRNPTAAEKKEGVNAAQPSSQAVKLLAELEKAKTKDLWRLLVALNIRHVGPVARVRSRSGSDPWMRSAPRREELAAVEGVGGIIADSLLDWFTVDWHQDIVQRWADAGVQWATPGHPGPGAAAAEGGVLDGLTIVATGSLDGYTREGRRRRSSRPAAKPRRASRRRPTSWPRDPAPAPSSPRRRSSDCGSSTRRSSTCS
jgi:DNA ligase (NAD+)